jgi:hypothetical protein
MNVGNKAIWEMRLLERLGINGPYVWTDPDIVPIEECPSNVLEFYLEVLKAYSEKSKVGFGLRVDDIPNCYKFKKEVVAWEAQFWAKKIAPKLYDADVDTTFALYRAGTSFDFSALRSGFPYLARHAPWYEDSEHPSSDQAYYRRNARVELNNWSGNELPEALSSALQERSTTAPQILAGDTE